MSIGIPIGVGVIVFTIILTWIYVNRANSEFDAESEAKVQAVKERLSQFFDGSNRLLREEFGIEFRSSES